MKIKKAHIELQSKLGYPIVQEKSDQPKGIWEQWQDGKLNDCRFVELISDLIHQGLPGISKDPMIRKGILIAILNFQKRRDCAETARAITSFLSAGVYTSESQFAGSNSWYKRAQLISE